MQVFGQLQRGLGIGCALHVDAHEVAQLRGMGDDLAGHGLAQLGRNIHADAGQLDRDVRVQARSGDAVQQQVVNLSRGAGTRLCGDAFPKGIE